MATVCLTGCSPKRAATIHHGEFDACTHKCSPSDNNLILTLRCYFNRYMIIFNIILCSGLAGSGWEGGCMVLCMCMNY